MGCDLSSRAIVAGRRKIDLLGLTNIDLVEADLAELAPAHDAFDYIIAHGMYSWVPPAARDALFALAQARLSLHGVMYVSYNALPGSRVRQVAWEVLHYGTDGIADPRQRLDAARQLARLVADGARSQRDGDDALRAAFRALAQRSDSELCHDDLAVPNDPVWFHAFVAHAARFGLRYVADADLHTMTTAGVEPAARAFIVTLDPVAREQYLDFIRLRRFRRSLLCRSEAGVPRSVDPERLLTMHVAADPSLLRAAQAGRTVETRARPRPGGWRRRPRSHDARHAGRPLRRHRLPRRGAARRRAVSTAACSAAGRRVRRQRRRAARPSTDGRCEGRRAALRERARALRSGRAGVVTNQLHARVRLPDANARRLLALLDGARDRASLARSLEDPSRGLGARDAERFVGQALDQFGRLALLTG